MLPRFKVWVFGHACRCVCGLVEKKEKSGEGMLRIFVRKQLWVATVFPSMFLKCREVN